MKAWERLINYVTVRTPSDEESETGPSSVCQFDVARKLEKEMKEASRMLEFEYAALLRDQIIELRGEK